MSESIKKIVQNPDSTYKVENYDGPFAQDATIGVKFSDDMFLLKRFLDQFKIAYKEEDLEDTELGRGLRMKKSLREKIDHKEIDRILQLCNTMMENLEIAREVLSHFQWIKCSERLPPSDNRVIVYDSGIKEITFGWYLPHNNIASPWRDDNFSEISASHWMPLPEEPKD